MNDPRIERVERSSLDATPDAPLYNKFQHGLCQHAQAVANSTLVWGIQVNEGWRSWILCSNMYEWAVDDLLRRLRAAPPEPWPHAACRLPPAA